MNSFQCINISKTLSKTFALSDISFTLSTGECIGIIGDNGSGKSTLMSILSGVLTRDGGEILYNDQHVTNYAKISYVPQENNLIEDLSVSDNLKLWQSVYGISEKISFPPFLKIEEMMNKKISMLSGGMKKKVSFAVALMNKPDFLILDESFTALDAKTIKELAHYLKNTLNIGIIYSSHNIHEIINLCDKILVIKDGKNTYYSENDQNFDIKDIDFLYSKF